MKILLKSFNTKQQQKANHVPSTAMLSNLQRVFFTAVALFTCSVSFGGIVISDGAEDDFVYPAAYGGNLTINKLTIGEESAEDFEDNTTYKVVITTIPGFKFSGTATIPGVSGDIETLYTESYFDKTLADGTVLEDAFLEFEFDIINKESADIDNLILKDIILTPIGQGETSYSGKLNVEVLKYVSATEDAAEYYDQVTSVNLPEGDNNYYMIEPSITFSNYSEYGCLGQDYSMTVNINDLEGSTANGWQGTGDKKDNTCLITYSSDIDAYADVDYIDEYLGGTTKNFTISPLSADYNAVDVHLVFKSTWELDATLTFGTSDTDVIYGDVDPIVFVDGDEITADIGDYIYIGSQITNSSYCTYYSADDYIDGSYFNTSRSSVGDHEVEITRTDPTSGCSVTEILTISVVPDLLLTDDVYCYSEGDEAIIQVSRSAFDKVFSDEDILVEFSYIQIKGNGIELPKIELTSVLTPIGDDYYDFAIKPAEIYDDITSYKEPGAVLNLVMQVYASASIPFLNEDEYNNLSKDAPPSFVEADDFWECTEEVDSDDDGDYYTYDCLHTYQEYNVQDLKVAEKYPTIAIPKNDGELQDYTPKYCQGTDTILLHPTSDEYEFDTVKVAIIDELVESISEEIFIDSIFKDTIIGVDTVSVLDTVYIDTIFTTVIDEVIVSDLDTSSSIIGLTPDYYLDLSKFPDDAITNILLSIEYSDENGCPGDTFYIPEIHTIPIVEIEQEIICDDAYLSFNQYSPDSGYVNVVNQTWDFGDGYGISNLSSSVTEIEENTHGGKTLGSYKQPSHQYDKPGEKFYVYLSVVSEAGCESEGWDSVIIGETPQTSFKPEGRLQDNPIFFTNRTDSTAYDTIAQIIYNITSPEEELILDTLYNLDLYEFTPEEYGVYKVHMQAITNNGCEASIDTLLPVYQVKVLDNDSTFFDGFSSASLSNGWIQKGEYLDDTTSGWIYRPFFGEFDDEDDHTDGNMWVTGLPENKDDDEQSWLESPCFDIRELDFPMLSLDVFQSLEPGRDGAAVYYSINDGDDWLRLGDIDDGGANWYNTIGIFNAPGEQLSKNEGGSGWSKDTTAWVVSRHALDSVRVQMDDSNWCVRFRVVYNSNSYHDDEYQGFGVDNFLVSKRRKVVLHEEFINSAYNETYPDEWANDLDELNTFVDALPLEVCDMRYHIQTFHDIDLLNSYVNATDVGARAAEYGPMSWGSMWVMDGVIANKYFTEVYDYDYMSSFEKRSLMDPSWDIKDVVTEQDGASLKITATISKISAHMDELLGRHDVKVRYAIVQREYTEDNGDKHRNVLVELLPSGVGNVVKTIRIDEFNVGDEITLTDYWIPNVTTVGNDFRLVIYVQGRLNYDEVEQVWFEDIDAFDIPQVSGVNDIQLSESTFRIYPNPVASMLNLENVSRSMREEVSWSILSINGRVMNQGVLNASEDEQQIDVRALPEGVYVIRLIQSDGTSESKRFSKIGAN